MSYHFSKIIELPFEAAVEKVTAELANEGFGVLTEIDVKATLKKKLDADFRNYRILGACNPPFAYKALQAERMVGAMLPCNVVVQDGEKEGTTEISAIDPVASMQAIENPALGELADTIRNKLKKVIDSL
jgi:uncharacterized protein (DUF302 family)